VAVRRVVVTPTFAVGLGVVIAAVLTYPMTRTVIRYGGPRVGGGPCQVKGCPSSPPAGKPAVAKPGLRIAPHSAGPGAGGTAPEMRFQTLRRRPDGFIGKVTIIDPGMPPAAHWQLRLSYGPARITGIMGGEWTARGGHTILVTGGYGYRHFARDGGRVQVVFAVSGSKPRPPSGCVFDGRACQTGQPD
jgi:hypothetical protein